MSLIQEVTVPKFKTPDGKVFGSAIEAEGHMVYLGNAPLIEGFVVAARLEKAQAGLMRRLLPQFMSFSSEFKVPEAAVAEAFDPNAADAAA